MIEPFPVIDTHTGGEITRIVFGDAIGITPGEVRDQLRQLQGDSDWVRQALTREPRGSAFAVGAIVMPPSADSKSWNIVFFNNVGYLGMCGHGLIGVVEALRHQNRVVVGPIEFSTPAGAVTAKLDADHGVSFTGGTSTCFRQKVSLPLGDGTSVVGDIAYGGNWFYLVHDDSLYGATVDELMGRATQIRDALDRHKIRGANDAVIDHVELYCDLIQKDNGLSDNRLIGCKNFVLCPGGHYDRSPCGTGTSAKLACLAARGELPPETPWVQESVTNSRFIASYRPDRDGVRVTVKGRAHVIAETKQFFDEHDPLRLGIQIGQRHHPLTGDDG